MCQLLPYYKEKFSLSNISWNFFATSHGKGSVDGIGGSAKRMVWQQVISRKVRVNNATDFHNVIREKNSKIQTIIFNDITEKYETFIAPELIDVPKV